MSELPRVQRAGPRAPGESGVASTATVAQELARRGGETLAAIEQAMHPSPRSMPAGQATSAAVRAASEASAAGSTRYPFFTEQLMAFETWLQLGREDRSPAPQLPVLLQVLMSNHHRARSLLLLARFVDLGPWAVCQALAVGLTPYIVKILAQPASRALPVFLWAKIIAHDPSVRHELAGHAIHFLRHAESAPLPGQRVLAVFVLAHLLQSPGCREDMIGENAHLVLAGQLRDFSDTMLRRVSCLALAALCTDHSAAKAACWAEGVAGAVADVLQDPAPETRAAAVHCLTCLMGV